MDEPEEISKGGSSIFRHGDAKTGPKLTQRKSKNFEGIRAHIQKHIGPYTDVIHEEESHLVPIDVHVVLPTEERPFYSLVTSGMSDKPMTVPEGCEELRYAELMICLPADWKMDNAQPGNAFHGWPIEQLYFLARLPHEHDTWLGISHTIPNGDPAEFLGSSRFCCALIGPTCQAVEEFSELKLADGTVINFYGVFFIYREEMDLKLDQGTEALWELFDANEVSELVDVHRKNAAG